MNQFLDFLDSLPVTDSNLAVLEAVRDAYSLLHGSSAPMFEGAKRKVGKLSNHASQRRVERGLRPCDIAKILKLGTWEPADHGRYKVSLDKDLFVIVAPDRHTIVTTVNTKMRNSDDIFRMVGDMAKRLTRQAVSDFADQVADNGGYVAPPDTIVRHREPITANRSERRNLLKKLSKDFGSDGSALDLLGGYSALCDNWKIRS